MKLLLKKIGLILFVCGMPAAFAGSHVDQMSIKKRPQSTATTIDPTTIPVTQPETTGSKLIRLPEDLSEQLRFQPVDINPSVSGIRSNAQLSRLSNFLGQNLFLGSGSQNFANRLGRVGEGESRFLMAKQLGMMPRSQIESMVSQLSLRAGNLSKAEQRLLIYGRNILKGNAGPEWNRIQAINKKYNDLLYRAVTKNPDGTFKISDPNALAELRTMATERNLQIFAQAHTAPGNRSEINDDLVTRNLLAFFGSPDPSGNGNVIVAMSTLPSGFQSIAETLRASAELRQQQQQEPVDPSSKITGTTAGPAPGSTASN